MIKAADEIFKLQDENQKLRNELAEYKDFLDLDTLEIYTENKRLKEGIKQAREEIENINEVVHDGTNHYYKDCVETKKEVLAILDRLIAEKES